MTLTFSIGLKLQVWPNKPVFWKNKSQLGNTDLSQVGLWIVSAAVKWLEGLSEEAKAGASAMTLVVEAGRY